jgi:hypothetical protein
VLTTVRNFLYRRYKPRLKKSLCPQHKQFRIEAASCPEITEERKHIPKQDTLELIYTRNCIKFFIRMLRLFLQYLKLTNLVIYTCTNESYILSNNSNTFYLVHPYTFNTGLLSRTNYVKMLCEIHSHCMPSNTSQRKSTQTQQLLILASFPQHVAA